MFKVFALSDFQDIKEREGTKKDSEYKGRRSGLMMLQVVCERQLGDQADSSLWSWTETVCVQG